MSGMQDALFGLILGALIFVIALLVNIGIPMWREYRTRRTGRKSTHDVSKDQKP